MDTADPVSRLPGFYENLFINTVPLARTLWEVLQDRPISVRPGQVFRCLSRQIHSERRRGQWLNSLKLPTDIPSEVNQVAIKVLRLPGFKANDTDIFQKIHRVCIPLCSSCQVF